MLRGILLAAARLGGLRGSVVDYVRLVNESSRVSSGGGVQPDPAGYESSS